MIGNPFNFEIPVITVFSRDTQCSRKQVFRVRARVCVRVCVCERVVHHVCAFLHELRRACGFDGLS